MLNRVSFQATKWVIQKLEALAPLQVSLLCIALVGIIGIIDHAITLDLAFSIFYLLPIAIATWRLGQRPGWLMALLSTGIWSWAEWTAKQYAFAGLSVWNTLVRLGIFAIVTQLLYYLKVAAEMQRQLARLDPITGAINRRFFEELLDIEYQRSARYRFPLTLAYLDVDNFKQVNDQQGHGAGDALLYQLVDQMSQALRANDVVARLGGDEFAVLLPQTNEQQAQQVFARLAPQIEQAIHHEEIPVSCSIGVVTFLAMPDTVESLLETADRLMYRIKTSGKSRIEYQVFTEATALTLDD